MVLRGKKKKTREGSRKTKWNKEAEVYSSQGSQQAGPAGLDPSALLRRERWLDRGGERAGRTWQEKYGGVWSLF